MSRDRDPLIPSVGEVNRRLSINAREERRLRTLLKLALEARDDAAKYGPSAATQPERISRYRREAKS
jgi:hypothetical protein